MRRQDIQLRTLARQGDRAAMQKLGRLYLQGGTGFARNVPMGLAHLRGLADEGPLEAALVICDCLPLEELVAHRQLDMLRTAAKASPAARIKLAAWSALSGEKAAALDLLERAGPEAGAARHIWLNASPATRLRETLAACSAVQPMDVRSVALAAAQNALERHDLERMADALTIVREQGDRGDPRFHKLVVSAIRLAERTGQPPGSLSPAQVQASLERVCAAGDIEASFILGRALCGLNGGGLNWRHVVESTNLRKGSALLLRAADAGLQEAWLHLYRISSDPRCSVANPQMARFCLEKAALSGSAEAQRRLGAIELREGTSLVDAERAIDLLFRAAASGDALAATLLDSLVLPLPGTDEEAFALIADVQQEDPWLAARLRLARHFGLTKLEALSVDPLAGSRPWGLVVGTNPFILQSRLSAPRAVPAVSPQALASLQTACAFFGGTHQDDQAIEGNLRKRSLNQRRLFQRLRLDERMFFSAATSAERDALRIGSRWARRARETLKLALGE